MSIRTRWQALVAGRRLATVSRVREPGSRSRFPDSRITAPEPVQASREPQIARWQDSRGRVPDVPGPPRTRLLRRGLHQR